MKIGFFSDVHLCDADDLGLGRHPRLAKERLLVAMQDFKREGCELCICLGDLVDRVQGDTKEDVLNYLRDCVSIIRQSDIPFFLVPGNHDFLCLNREDFINEGVALAPFIHKIGGYSIVALDANHRANGEHFDTAGEKWDDANIPSDQLSMLDSTLCENDNCIILIHESLDPCVDFSHQVRNATEARGIISKHHERVKLVIQGHFHWGSYNKIDDVPYLTLESMCVSEKNPYKIIEI